MEKIDIHRKPKGLYRFLSRIPGYLYRIGFSSIFEASMLILSTKGRKSGKTFRVPLGYARKVDCVYVAALYKSSDWYRNAIKNPEVEIQIGKTHMKAHASKVDDLEEKAKAYRAIVRANGERGAKTFYYTKPMMNNEEIGNIGKKLPIIRFEIKG